MITFEKYISEATLEIGKRIYEYSPPIFSNKNITSGRVNKARPMPIASSVLFTINERYFLVTAAHVFKRHRLADLGLFHGNLLYHLNGDLKLSNPNSCEKDRLDIAILELERGLANDLAVAFKFYDLIKFNPDHPHYNDARYLVVGTPLTRHKLKLSNKKIINYPFIFLTKPIDSETTYDGLGVRTYSHLLVDYTKRRIQNSSTRNYQMGPQPVGLSGCGIWTISRFLRFSSSDFSFYPSGILIEYDANYHSIISTRMRIITEILRQGFNVEIQRTRVDLNIENTRLANFENFKMDIRD